MNEHKCNICEKHEDMDAVSCCVCNFRGDCGTSSCPLTNSSHEKALVRVVEKKKKGGFVVGGARTAICKDFIQVLCSCGHIISENEIK